MNSNFMKDCLVTNNFVPETNSQRHEVPFAAHNTQIKDLPLNSRTYETPTLPSNVTP